MKGHHKLIIIMLFICTMLMSAGCATIEGAGRDIESAGEEIQEAAEDSNK